MQNGGKKLRGQHKTQSSAPVCMEALEERQLCSATLNHAGLLTIRGTPRNDTITVSQDPEYPARLLVNINGQKRSFAQRKITSVRVYAGRGDDRVRVGTRMGKLRAQLTINGGPGHNTIVGWTARKARPAAGTTSGTGQPQNDGNPTPVDLPGGVVSPTTGPIFGRIGGPASDAGGALNVYDLTFHLDKPSTTGMLPVYWTDREFYAWTGSGYDQTHPDEAATRSLARRAAYLGRPVVLDIEHWPVDIRMDSRVVVDKSITMLGQIVDWLHDEAPGLQVSFYGLMPLRDYFVPVRYLLSQKYAATDPWWDTAQYTADYREWQAANDYLAPLAAKVDFICPSLYTFYEDREGWAAYAKGNLMEAMRYGKPLMPFVMPEYHDSNSTLLGQDLPADYWQLELDTIRQYTSNMAIWAGWKTAADGSAYRAEWDDTAAWWVATKAAMNPA